MTGIAALIQIIIIVLLAGLLVLAVRWFAVILKAPEPIATVIGAIVGLLLLYLIVTQSGLFVF